MEILKPSQIARREWENIRASLEMCGDIGEFDSKNHINEKSISKLSILVRNLITMDNKVSTHHYFTKEAAYVFSTLATIAGESLGLKRRLARAFGSGYSLVRTGDPCLSAMEKQLLKQIIFLKLFFPVEGYFNWDFSSPLVKAKMKVVFDKFVKWQDDPRSYLRDLECHVSELKPIWRVLSLDSRLLAVDESMKTPEESFPHRPPLTRKTPRDFKNLIFPDKEVRKMRKAIASVVFLAFIATSGLGFAATKTGSQEVGWISGKVTAIDNGLLSLRKSNGQIFRVASTGDKLKGVHIGDRVVVKDVNGWVASIKEISKKSAKSHTSLTHRQA